jgi:hypothetical protein
MSSLIRKVYDVILIYLACYNFNMDKKSRILILIFLAAILISSIVSSYKYLIIKDFVIIDSTK